MKLKWTLSKIGAYCIILVGMIESLCLKSSEVAVISLVIAGGLLGWKQHRESAERMVNGKKMVDG